MKQLVHFEKKVVFALIMLFNAASALCQSRYFEIDELNYYIISENDYTVRVSGHNGEISGSVVIPGSVEYGGYSYSVIAIGSGAFENCTELTSVIIPSSVNSIGVSAFSGCSSLSSIVLPSCVSEIGDWAFYQCCNLSSVEIPSSLTTINDYVFYGCTSLTSVMIPDNVEWIEWRSFSDCTNLIDLTISEGVLGIGSYSFSGCTQLSSITIPSTVTSIVDNPFIGCCNLESIHVNSYNTQFDSRNDCNAIIRKRDDVLIAGCKNTIVPSGVEGIGDEAFEGCTDLTSITIPEGVATIGDKAFYGCSGLSSINISEDITTIGRSAFGGCSSLLSIDIPLGINSIGSSAFVDCTSLVSIAIPSGLASIENAVFSGCTALRDATIQLGVSIISNNAFKGCSSLISITIPASVTTIGESAFEGCSSLGSILLPDGIIDIGRSAFRDCSSLTRMIFPSSVKTIRGYMLSGCSSLNSIYLSEGVTSIGPSAFSGAKLSSLHIPFSLKTIESQTFYNCCVDTLFWNSEVSINSYNQLSPKYVVIGDSVKTISNSFLSFCDSLEIVIMSPCVTDVGASVFVGCTSLKTIVFSPNISTIGRSAFSGCTSLKSITLPNQLIIIGSYAFEGCNGLTSIAIPEHVTSIGYMSFSGCTSLRFLSIPASVTSIGNGAFSECNKISTIVVNNTNEIYDSRSNCNAIIKTSNNELILGCYNTVIPSSVESIGAMAFSGCTYLTSITIPSNVKSIGNNAFTDCVGLSSISIPNGVNRLLFGSFSGCRGLKSLTIPASVSFIADNSFAGCSGLNAITVSNGNQYYDSREGCNAIISKETDELIAGCKNTIIPSSVLSIGCDAFYGCTGLSSIVIPKGVTSIGSEAFCGCTSLAYVTIYSNQIIEIYGGEFESNATDRKFFVFDNLMESYKMSSGWKYYYVDNIEAIPDLTANDAGGGLGNWCTYYNGLADVRMPDDVEIYKASLDGDRVVLTEIDGHVVKRGEGVLLKSTNSSITLLSAPNEFDGDYSDNVLKGVDYETAQDEGKTYYVLSKKGDAFGFYKLNPEVSLGANKAYLMVENPNLAPMRSFYGLDLNNGTETSVATPIVEGNGDWFSIYGVKLNGEPTENGLYIRNGKKVLINDKSVF